MFVLSFANFKSRALSHNPSGDRVMPRAEMRVRAQASHGNITVLSHLKVVEHSIFDTCVSFTFFSKSLIPKMAESKLTTQTSVF